MGNYHVRFLGGKGAARLPTYPVMIGDDHMNDEKATWSVTIDAHDVRYYLEHPKSHETEIHCYHLVETDGRKDHKIVLRMCFYSDACKMPRVAAHYPPEKPDYENEDVRITLHYPIACFDRIYAILTSGAPVDFLHIIGEDGKPYHRLHARTR